MGNLILSIKIYADTKVNKLFASTVFIQQTYYIGSVLTIPFCFRHSSILLPHSMSCLEMVVPYIKQHTCIPHTQYAARSMPFNSRILDSFVHLSPSDYVCVCISMKFTTQVEIVKYMCWNTPVCRENYKPDIYILRDSMLLAWKNVCVLCYFYWLRLNQRVDSPNPTGNVCAKSIVAQTNDSFRV